MKQTKLTKAARGRDCSDGDIAPILGYEDLYAVTRCGEVLSSRKGWSALSHGVKPEGYAFVGLYGVGGKPKYRMVHRLVAQAFVPNLLGKPEVNHKDGNKLNNHADNLEWATRSENAQHGHDSGLMPQGCDHHSTKLQPIEVVEIFGAEGRYRDIGERYGVCAQTVCNIKKRRIHKRTLESAGL